MLIFVLRNSMAVFLPIMQPTAHMKLATNIYMYVRICKESLPKSNDELKKLRNINTVSQVPRNTNIGLTKIGINEFFTILDFLK